jgi:soluble P-type ATPase
MKKPGIKIVIPRFGSFSIKAVVSDYTGTLACGGRLAQGVDQRLVALSKLVDIHVITADTFNTADNQLKGLPLSRHRLQTNAHDKEKANYVLRKVGNPKFVAALGNGNNDRLLMRGRNRFERTYTHCRREERT